MKDVKLGSLTCFIITTLLSFSVLICEAHALANPGLCTDLANQLAQLKRELAQKNADYETARLACEQLTLVYHIEVEHCISLEDDEERMSCLTAAINAYMSGPGGHECPSLAALSQRISELEQKIIRLELQIAACAVPRAGNIFNRVINLGY